MYAISAFMLAVACRRLVPSIRSRWGLLYLGVLGSSVAARVVTQRIGILIFAAQIIAVAVLELGILRTRGTARAQALIWAVAGAFLLSFGLWILDATRLWCNPLNHLFNGHALWHVGTACSLLVYSRFVDAVSSQHV